MAANRLYTPEEKLRILLEGMSGIVSVADLCGKYDIKPARFYYWKDQLLNSEPEIFENRGCNRRLIFVHFHRNKSDPDRRFNSDPFPHVEDGLSCTGWRCGE